MLKVRYEKSCRFLGYLHFYQHEFSCEREFSVISMFSNSRRERFYRFLPMSFVHSLIDNLSESFMARPIILFLQSLIIISAFCFPGCICMTVFVFLQCLDRIGSSLTYCIEYSILGLGRYFFGDLRSALRSCCEASGKQATYILQPDPTYVRGPPRSSLGSIFRKIFGHVDADAAEIIRLLADAYEVAVDFVLPPAFSYIEEAKGENKSLQNYQQNAEQSMHTISSGVGAAEDALEQQIREDSFREACPEPPFASISQELTVTYSDGPDLAEPTAIFAARNDQTYKKAQAQLELTMPGSRSSSLLKRKGLPMSQRLSKVPKSLTGKEVERFVAISSTLGSRLHRHWFRPCPVCARKGMNGLQRIHGKSAQPGASYSSPGIAESVYKRTAHWMRKQDDRIKNG